MLTGRPLFIAIVVPLFIILFPLTALAVGDVLVGAFIDDGVSALGRGGLEQLPHRPETLDFGSPLFLDSHGKYRLETEYENQRTVRLYHGRWAGTHAYSDHLETAAAAPFSLFGDRLKGNVSAGYGQRSEDVLTEEDSEKLRITDNTHLETIKGGVYLQAVDRLFLGVSVISDSLRSPLEVPVEVEVAPISFLRLGYKRFYLDNLVANIDATMSADSASLKLKDLEEVNELNLTLDYPDLIYVKFANELKITSNRAIEGKLRLPASLYLVGNYVRREYAGIDQDITVNGAVGGKIGGGFLRSEYRIGAGAVLGDTWTVEANFRHQDFSTQGGGVASSRAVAGFWPSLLLGNYNYLYLASLAGDQYHLGGEYQGERFSFSLGLQYLCLKPQADLSYNRSLLFGLGKTGAGSLDLGFDRVEMLFLSFGLGYRWGNFDLKYAFGQFIPVAIHQTGEDASPPSTGGGTGSGNTGGGGFFSNLADKFIHNPGGNIQRIMLSVTF